MGENFKLPNGWNIMKPAGEVAADKAKAELEALIGSDLYFSQLAALEKDKKDHGYTDEWLREQTVQLNRAICTYMQDLLSRYDEAIDLVHAEYQRVKNTNFQHSYTERDYADLQYLQTLIKSRIVNECDNEPTIQSGLVERVVEDFIHTEKGARAIMFLAADSQIGELLKPYYPTAAKNAKTAAERKFDADKAAKLDQLSSEHGKMVVNSVIGGAVLQAAQERLNRDAKSYFDTDKAPHGLGV